MSRIFYEKLTPREQEICELLITGWDDEAICKKLIISAGTLNNHKRKIFLKRQVSKLSQLIINHHKGIYGAQAK